MEKDELIVYLAAAKEIVSAVLMTEREAKQMPIYFVSRALRGPELNYTSMEKLVLALVHANHITGPEYRSKDIISILIAKDLKRTLWNSDVTRGDAPMNKDFIYGRILLHKMVPEQGYTHTNPEVTENNVAKEAEMVRYLEEVKALTSGFKALQLEYPRSGKQKS
ncbi:reverse transcriptase domain-containing protein [Tanacetum coccineum]